MKPAAVVLFSHDLIATMQSVVMKSPANSHPQNRTYRYFLGSVKSTKQLYTAI